MSTGRMLVLLWVAAAIVGVIWYPIGLVYLLGGTLLGMVIRRLAS